MKNVFSVIIILFYVINEVLITKNSQKTSERKNNNNERQTKKLKIWEELTNWLILLSIFFAFFSVLFHFPKIIEVMGIIYYVSCLSAYVAILLSVIMKNKNEEVTNRDLRGLMLIPIMLVSVYNYLETIIIGYGVLQYKGIFSFAIKNSLKYFIISFFVSIDFFIFLKELFILVGKTKKPSKEEYQEFNLLEYEYTNARDKKGISFIKAYSKDVFIAIKKIIYDFFYIHIINGFIFSFIILKRFLRKITNNYSMYVIIMKTFNVSIIVSLLITYYQLLSLYPNEITLELYSVVITVIIIPSALAFISDLSK